jgi:hypothetical protein
VWSSSTARGLEPSGGRSTGRLYAIGADELFLLRRRCRQPGCGDGPALGFLVCQFEVQAEEEGQVVFGVFHAVGGADGGVEGGLGVAKAVGAGGCEDASEVAQGPAVGGRDLAVAAVRVSIMGGTCHPAITARRTGQKNTLNSLATRNCFLRKCVMLWRIAKHAEATMPLGALDLLAPSASMGP